MKDWEKAYQEGLTPWDKGYASPAIAEWLQKNSLKGGGLVLGCGLGHDVRLLASYNNQVTGIDISQTAISKARAMDVVNNESYRVADFFNLSEDYSQSFDWVVEHTFFCAITPDLRQSYVENLVNMLKPKDIFSQYFSEKPVRLIQKVLHIRLIRSCQKYFGKDFNILESFPTSHYECRPKGSEYMCCMQLK